MRMLGVVREMVGESGVAGSLIFQRLVRQQRCKIVLVAETPPPPATENACTVNNLIIRTQHMFRRINNMHVITLSIERASCIIHSSNGIRLHLYPTLLNSPRLQNLSVGREMSRTLVTIKIPSEAALSI